MAGLQSVTTPVSGNTISSTLFGIPVAGNLTVLANPPIAKMTNSGAQSIATSTSTALTWDSETYDTVNGHSTVTNTSRYTVQTGYAGYYQLRAVVAWNGNATGVRRTWFAVNGTAVDATEQRMPGNATNHSASTETALQLAVGDYVEVFVNQNSGGALALITGGAGQAFQSWFEIEWIHQ